VITFEAFEKNTVLSLLLESAGAAENSLEHVLVKMTTLSTLFFAKGALLCTSRRTIRSTVREERLHCLSDVRNIQDDDLCLRFEKETTVCYKWLLW